MNNKKKVVWNTVLFLTILGLTMYGVFHGENLDEMKQALIQAKVRWLLPAAGCVFIFIWGESLIIWYMLRTYGIHVKEALCFLISSVGFFFSCVTPSATGGQPMQIYFMKKEKIPIPVSTVILMIVTITYKLVLVVIGLGILLFGRGFQEQYLTGILPVFYLGIALNVFCVTFMMILVFHPSLAKKIMVSGLKLLERFHLMKKKESRLEKLEASMDMYNETAAFMRDHKILIVNVFLITFGSGRTVCSDMVCVHGFFHFRTVSGDRYSAAGCDLCLCGYAAASGWNGHQRDAVSGNFPTGLRRTAASGDGTFQRTWLLQ